MTVKPWQEVAKEDKKEALWWATLFCDALRECEDVQQARLAADMAFALGPVPEEVEPEQEEIALAVEEEESGWEAAFSHDNIALAWVPTNTRNHQGLPGWKSTVTGEYRYQQKPPDSISAAQQRQQGQPAPKPSQQSQQVPRQQQPQQGQPTPNPAQQPQQTPKQPQPPTPKQPTIPQQPTKTPPVKPPANQPQILSKIRREAQNRDLNDAMRELQGVNLQHNAQIPIDVADQFDAHGTSTLETLTQLLNGGVDPNRKFYSSQLSASYDKEKYGTSVRDSSSFVVLSHPGQTIKQGGIPAVMVDPLHESSIPDLQQAFPGVKFISTKDAATTLAKVAGKYRGGIKYSLNAMLAHDIFNKQAQGILNRAVKATSKLAAATRRDLAAALKSDDPAIAAQKIIDIIAKHRVALAALLGATNLAAVLEGALEVARKVPPVPIPGTAPPLPPTLTHEESLALLTRLKTMPAVEQTAHIVSLPAEQQSYIRAMLAQRAAEPPIPPPPFAVRPPPDGAPEHVQFPTIENAVEELRSKRLIDRAAFERLDSAARTKAFTVAGVDAQETLGKIRDALAENVRKGVDYKAFRESILAEVEPNTFLDEGHLCFCPGTLVEGHVLAASKIWYSGPIAEIETDDGRRLRVTVHHPVLTAYGWKNAGDIQQGDQLVCYGNPVESLNHSPDITAAIAYNSSLWKTVNHQNTPASVEDIFQSLFRQSHAGLRRIFPVRSLDFHGDAAFTKGKVYCVGTNRVLRNHFNADRSQLLHQVGFVHGRIAATDKSSCRGLRLLNTRRHAAFFAANSGVSVSHATFSRFVSTPLSFVPVPDSTLRIGSAANLDPILFKKRPQISLADVTLFCQLFKSFPGLVSTHNVVDVKLTSWQGHVYDLQTATGWIVSQGVITSNSNVFRTNIQGGFSDGQMKVLNHPFIRSGFPYSAYDSIHDDRRRETHRYIEEHGIDGSNIYRNDDPVFQLFRPPWDFMDRCSWTPITIHFAAEKGVKEAKRWLETGIEPSPPAYVPMPPFQPPPGFRRAIDSAPLSIRLSMLLSLDDEKPVEEATADVLMVGAGDPTADGSPALGAIEPVAPKTVLKRRNGKAKRQRKPFKAKRRKRK